MRSFFDKLPDSTVLSLGIVSVLSLVFVGIVNFTSNLSHFKLANVTTSSDLVSQAGTSLDNGLVAHFKFDEGTGSSASDEKGNASGEISGATWVDGKFGKALQFDGKNDGVVSSSTPILNYPFTFSVWVNTSGQTATASVLGFYRSDLALPIYDIGVNTSGTAYLHRRTDSGYTNVTINGLTPLGSGWHHIAGVFESPSVRKLYVDGLLEGELTTGSKSFVAVNSIAFGKRNDSSPSNYFNGIIDDAKIYNRALTDVEISVLAEKTSTAGLDEALPDPIPYSPGILKVKKDGTGHYLTIQSCIDAAQPGDTCLVSPGEYDEEVTFRKSGFANRPITIKAEFPFVYGQTPATSIIKDTVTLRSYTRLIGMEVSGAGVLINGSNTEVSNNYIHGTEARAVTGVSVIRANPYHSDITVKDNHLYMIGYGILFNCSDNCLVENNRIERLYTEAACRPAGACPGDRDYVRIHGNGITIRGNFIGGSSLAEIDEDAHVDGIQSFSNGGLGGQGRDTITNILIENNTVQDNHQNIWWTTSNNGLWSSDVTIRNNTFLNTWGTSARMSIGGPFADRLYIYNNTFGQSVRIVAADVSVVKNNIFLGNYMNTIEDRFAWPQKSYEMTNNVLSTNSWLNNSIKNTYSAALAGTNNIFTGDVGLTSRSNPRPLSSSVVIDKGANLSSTGFSNDITGVSRPKGLAWDIGAYEFNGSVTNPAPTIDTTAPTVSITSPINNSTVSGSISLVASATDNVEVSGLQFKLNGSNLGVELTQPPYSGTWNTQTSPNGTYKLTAVARDAAGNTTTSATVTVVISNPVPDTTAPSIPQNLTATAVSSSQINLSWSASTDASGISGYRIYRNGTLLTTKTGTSHTDIGLSSETAYTYTVSAVDNAGNISQPSTAAQTTTLKVVDTTAPIISTVAVKNLTTTSATITWTTNEPADSQVEYGVTSALGSQSTLSGAFVTSHSVGLVSLTPGTTYSYRVKSKDAAGNVRTGTVLTFKTNEVPVVQDTTPPVISNVTASVKKQTVTITWNTNEPSIGNVQYGTNTNYGSTENSSTLATTHSVVLKNLSRNTTYHYKVEATDALGNTSLGSDLTFTTNARAEKPPRVTNVSAKDGSIVLSWDVPQYEFTDKIKVVRSTSRSPSSLEEGTVVADLSLTTETWTDNSANEGVLYHYAIFTIDDEGVASEPAFISYRHEKEEEQEERRKRSAFVPKSNPEVAEPVANRPETTTVSPRFSRTLSIGSRGEDVRQLQIFLNSNGYIVSTTGAGSPGRETTYYGPATARAVTKLQEANRDSILRPAGLARGNGRFGPRTLQFTNSINGNADTPVPDDVKTLTERLIMLIRLFSM